MPLSIKRKAEQFFATQLAAISGSELPFLTSTSETVDPDPPYFVILAVDAEEIVPLSANYKLDLRAAIVTAVGNGGELDGHEQNSVLLKAALERIPQVTGDADLGFEMMGFVIDKVSSDREPESEALIDTWRLRVGCRSLEP